MGVPLDLAAAWCRMWARSRGTAPPNWYGRALRTHVGLPDQTERFVFPALETDRIRELAEEVHDPGVFIKVCAPAEEVAPLLPSRWTIGEPRFFMTAAPLQVYHAPISPAYSLSLHDESWGVLAKVTSPTGEVVGRAGLLLEGETAVLDRLEVDPGERGRGLAAALVTNLHREAAKRGGKLGALVATIAGRRVYRRFGWVAVSDYTSATISA